MGEDKNAFALVFFDDPFYLFDYSFLKLAHALAVGTAGVADIISESAVVLGIFFEQVVVALIFPLSCKYLAELFALYDIELFYFGGGQSRFVGARKVA